MPKPGRPRNRVRSGARAPHRSSATATNCQATGLGEKCARAGGIGLPDRHLLAEAAKSHWVNEEILTFKRLGREHRIFALIVDGEPGARPGSESSASRRRSSTGWAPTACSRRRGEPIAADGRPGKDSKLDVKLKLLAGMLGVGLDELKQREAHRRHVRMMWLVAHRSPAWPSPRRSRGRLDRAQRGGAAARAGRGGSRDGAPDRRFMVGLFKVSDPSEARGNTITAREILDRGARRIETELVEQPAIQATLMDTMGTVYTSLGLYAPALRLVRQHYEKRRKLWGEENAEVADSLNHLGEVLTLKSDYAEAETRLREALEIRMEVVRGTEREVAATLSAARAGACRKGRGYKGRALDPGGARDPAKVHGHVHPDVARSLEDLGPELLARGEYEQAVGLLREASGAAAELHPSRASGARAVDGQPRICADGTRQGREAEPLCRLALAMKRQLYGRASGNGNRPQQPGLRPGGAEATSSRRRTPIGSRWRSIASCSARAPDDALDAQQHRVREIRERRADGGVPGVAGSRST